MAWSRLLIVLVVFFSGCAGIKKNAKNEVFSISGFSRDYNIGAYQRYLRSTSSKVFNDWSATYSRKLTNIPQEYAEGYGLCILGQYKNGEKLLKSILVNKKEKMLSWLYLGHCLFLKKDFLRARLFYGLVLGNNKLLTKRIKYSVYNNIALMFFERRSFAQGEFYLNRAKKEMPRALPHRYNLALMHFLLGNYKDSHRIMSILNREVDGDSQLKELFAMISILLNKDSEASQVISSIPEKTNEVKLLSAWINWKKGENASSVYKRISGVKSIHPMYKRILNQFKKYLVGIIESEKNAKNI